MPLKLVSINVERSKHLDTVTPFLLAQQADLVCMQELCERDIAHFEQALGMRCIFAPAGRHPDEPDHPEEPVTVGDGIFTSLPLSSTMIDYYAGSEEGARTTQMHHTFRDLALISAIVEKGGASYQLATLHFTWTPKGGADDRQRADLAGLLKILAAKGELVFCGDFNAPRLFEEKHGEIYTALAAQYKDNIPARYATSLDPKYHRAPLPEQADKMVDYIFSTPGYVVADVAFHHDISDHCAITATVTKA